MKHCLCSSEATLLVRICDVIAKGLVAPWVPKPIPKSESTPAAQTAPAATTKETARKKGGGKTAAGNANTGGAAAQAVKAEGMDDLKRALEVGGFRIFFSLVTGIFVQWLLLHLLLLY